MSKSVVWFYRWLLPGILRKRCPDPIPRSGSEAAKINCFAVFLDDEQGHYFIGESIDGFMLKGKLRSGQNLTVDGEVDLRTIAPEKFHIKHYYGITTIRFPTFWHFVRNRLSGYIYIKVHIERTADAAGQFVFNKKRLVTLERIRLLQFLIDHHIENRGRPISSIDIMTGLHTLRWVLHPSGTSAEKKLELYLESLCASDELRKQGMHYLVNGSAVGTIERFEEEERRHSENLRIQAGILILTLAIAFLTAVQASLIKFPTLIDFTR